MAKNLNTYKDSLHLIADILSFDYPTETLKHQIVSEDIDWDALVVIASDHLILTTVFARLQQKNLLEYIPKELEIYLKQLTAINTNRNQDLLIDVQTISDIFNKQHIDYTFLKGAAMLVSGYYEHLGERMLGDIDILVSHDHIQSAYQLLKDHGYIEKTSGLKSGFFEHKHLNRLVKEDGLCAIELHKYVLNKPVSNYLLSPSILKNKQYKERIPIPSNKDLFLHNILNFQINDEGHYYSKLGMRSAYDLIVLIHHHPALNQNYNEKVITSYMTLHSLLFDIFKTANFNPKKLKRFQSRLHSKSRNNLRKTLLTWNAYMRLIPSRLSTLLSNKNYRFAVYKDRRRIFKELKTKFLKG
ncbi:nucleotidyltransferase family protein [Psychroserpens sp. BH13MA-6]